MSLLLHWNGSLAGVSGLSPKSHVRGVPSALAGGAPRLPLSANDGCSGQAPVSSPPKITPLPAFGLPPAWAYSALAPMKSELASVDGLVTASFWTATTPLILTISLILFAGTVSATPPYTVRSFCPTLAVGATFFRSP